MAKSEQDITRFKLVMSSGSVTTRKMAATRRDSKAGNSTPSKSDSSLDKYFQKRIPESSSNKKQKVSKAKAMPTPSQRNKTQDRKNANLYHDPELQETDSDIEK